MKIPSLGIEGSESGIGTPVRIFENDDGCDDNDMVDGIEADLEIDTGELMQFIFPASGNDFELRDGCSEWSSSLWSSWSK